MRISARVVLIAALLAAACSRTERPEPDAGFEDRSSAGPAGQNPEPGTEADVRTRNRATYDQHRARLATDHKGAWALIADGRLVAPVDSFERALEIADRMAPHDAHRFIWRPGVDDVPRTFSLSMWLDEPGKKGRWMQAGMALPGEFGVSETIGGGRVIWTLQGRSASWPMPTVSEVGLTLRSLVNFEEVRVTFVRSLMFTHFVTLDPPTAKRLEVATVSVPGMAGAEGFPDVHYALAWVRVAVPELEIDRRVLAFLVPPEIWK